jgi:tetratricopeptide (TPR) repeat protein
MKRTAIGFALVLGLCGLARADIVTVKDPNKQFGKDIEGDITDESPAGIKLKEKGKTAVTTFAAGDIQAVVYSIPNVPKQEFNRPEQSEVKALVEKDAKKRKALLDTAFQEFKDLEGKVETNPKAKRYVAYRLARCKVYMARDDKALRKEAVDGLITYRKTYTDGWEILPALLMLAQMQEEDKDVTGAAETLEQILSIPDLPPDIRQKNMILVAEKFFAGKQYQKAEEKLDAAIKALPPNSPERTKLQVYLIKAQLFQKKTDNTEATLREVIRGHQEPEVRAMAYNLLGDFYMIQKKDEEAFWSYLRVHVMYHGTPEEEAKALYHLWKLFPKVHGGDPVRARECYDQLMLPKYDGTEFRTLADKEPKPGN